MLNMQLEISDLVLDPALALELLHLKQRDEALQRLLHDPLRQLHLAMPSPWQTST